MSDILDSLDDLDDDDFELEELEDDSEVLHGEIVETEDFDLENYEMNERQAKEITEAIRSAATATFILVAEAHKHKAWKALGYDTWAAYVKEEFDITASRSYQLLDLSKAVEMIEEATPEGTQIKLTEAQARDIKRELPKITEQIREETSGMSPEDAAARAAELIEESREEIKAQKEEEKAIKEKAAREEEDELEERQAELESQADALLEADRPDGITDMADDGFLEVDLEGDGDSSLSQEDSMHLYNFFNGLSSIVSLPEPDEFINIIPESRAEEINTQLIEVASWLNRLQTLWELREDNS